MAYRVTLNGKPLPGGDIRQAQASVADAVTGLLQQDPGGVAPSASRANQDFTDGTVAASVAVDGAWTCSFQVNGDPVTLTVTGEDPR